MSTQAATEGATMLYLVGLGPAGSMAGLDAPGLEDGQRTRVVGIDAGGERFDAVVVDVPAEMFTGEDAEARLGDVAWLTPRAERHEAIIRKARARASMMPVGFGGVFSGAAAIEAAIAERAGEVARFLDETAGCDEWSLKAWVSRADAVARAREAIAEEQAHRGGDGAAYLRARRLDAEAETLAEEHALGLVEGLIEDLGEAIADAAERRATSVEDDPDRWLIAHIALLIDRGTRAAFDARLDDLAAGLEAEGLRLELTGPWSPYTFCPAMGDAAE